MTIRGGPVQLTDAEIHLLQEALDSHEYWQLSDAHERNNGYSTVDDGANAEIDAVRALASKLSLMAENATQTVQGEHN